MAPPLVADPEAAFRYWYNDGRRRTFQQVADHTGAGYSTIRRYADDNDWDRRADKLDADVREATDKAVAADVAKQRAANVQMARAVLARFAQRLPERVRDRDGREVENPHYLAPGDIGVREAELLFRYVELMGGHATHRFGVETEDERIRSLAELEQEIAELDVAELTGGAVDLDTGESLDVHVLPPAEEGGTDNAKAD
jgi:hypothetical protein